MRLKSIFKCKTCERELPRNAFDPELTNQGRTNGLKRVCRECLAATPAKIRARAIAQNESRFWSYVDTSGGPDACWPWTGGLGDGYGKFHVAGVGDQRAHRVAFTLAHGRAPVGLVRHLVCDNRPCCNPAHLAEGTHLDNMQDMTDHGRQAKGDRKGTAKLTEQIVRDARLRYKPRDARNGAAALAREFGVTTNNMCKALSGETWKHVDMAPGHCKTNQYAPAKLSDGDVAEIRVLYSKGGRVCALARRYGVSHSLISGIVHGKRRAT